jgi:O-6-methylguanine DNA methyltransferase
MRPSFLSHPPRGMPAVVSANSRKRADPLFHRLTVPSRYGSLSLVVGPRGIRSLDWARARKAEGIGASTAPEDLPSLLERIRAHLDGKEDETLPLVPEGTAFQKRVWETLRTIPRGEVRSYGEVARLMALPGGARAVAQACGANPIVLLIPCHRVVASDGGLGGYGPGVDLKIAILRNEGITVRKCGARWVLDAASPGTV